MPFLTVTFLEHRELHLVGQATEFLDLFFGARLLAHEVVRRETEHDETVITVVLVELLERIVLWRIAALGRRVDDEYDLAGVGLTEIDDLIRRKSAEILIEQRIIGCHGHACGHKK